MPSLEALEEVGFMDELRVDGVEEYEPVGVAEVDAIDEVGVVDEVLVGVEDGVMEEVWDESGARAMDWLGTAPYWP
jgi:hypothetical protein